MPIYLYRCDSCGQNHEALQKVGAEPPAACPNCGAEGQMKKKIAPVGVIFKGSGFHKNDYTGGGGGGKKADSASEGGGDKGGDKGDSGSKTESTTPSPSSDSGGGSTGTSENKVA